MVNEVLWLPLTHRIKYIKQLFAFPGISHKFGLKLSLGLIETSCLASGLEIKIGDIR